MSAEPFAWVIASTQVEAAATFKRWAFGGQTHSLEGKRVCFKGEADARYLLAERRKEDGPGSALGIWKIRIEAEQVSLAVSETGVPPYKDGDIITVYDRRYGDQFKARVTEVLLAGARYPWVVHFESLKPVAPNDSRYSVGSLEADDEGNSPYIIKD